MLLAGIEAGERLIAQVEAIRHGGPVDGTVGGTASASEPAAKPATKVPVTSGWRQRFAGEVPERVREAGARLRPRAQDDYRFSTGIADGHEVHSGGNDRSLAADLEHGPLKGPPVTF